MAAIHTSIARTALGSVALASMSLLSACGGEAPPPPELAKAFDQKSPIMDDEKSAEAMRAMRQKAEAEAAKAREAELEKITSVGAPLPADIEQACTAASESFDKFRTTRLAHDPTALERWNATKEPDLRKFVESCKESGKIEVGACFTSALRDASMAMFGEGSDLELIERCKKRWGADEVAAAPGDDAKGG